MQDSLASVLTIRLLDESGDSEGEWQFQPDQQVRIGRSSSNECQMRYNTVSKLHATLCHQENGWICQSVGRNGVYYQGRRIEEMEITDGIVLRFSAEGPRLHFQLLTSPSGEQVEVEPQEVSAWIEGLARGDADAANYLWEEYFERVMKLARSRIASRQRRVTDEEDVAVSVFKSICDGLQKGRFPDLKDSDGLWRLLCVMTKRKVIRHANHEHRQKRGGGQIRGESVFGGAGNDSNAFGLEQFRGDGDDAFGQQLLEQTEWLFETLGDDELRRITELKLAGHTNEEIAEKMECHVRTIKRRLQTIRSILSAAMADGDCQQNRE